MKKSPVQRTEENNRMDYFLKELNIRRPSSPGLKPTSNSLEKMPSIDSKDKYEVIVKGRGRVQENRSISELSGRFGSLDLNHSRRMNNGSPAPELNSMKKTNKVRLPKLEPQENELISNDFTSEKKNPSQANSITIDMTKKRRLQPLKHDKIRSAYKTKAGTNGNQVKINQDAVIIDTKLPHDLKIYCVCDGHGLNGHLVSSFIRVQLIKNLNKLLKKVTERPEKIVPIIQQAFELTNNELLSSEINTDLSGSTVVAVFIYGQKIYCFNVGDSRAILLNNSNGIWKCKPLSDDQKPSREDEKQRILKFGGRVEAQVDESGKPIGPLRVWMANLQLPGLAMTRSFGDKAGVRAGTNGIPQITQHDITPDDRMIVVASDGVWEYIENEQVMQLLVPFADRNSLDLGCERIVNHASAVWRKVCLSRDDITIILVGLQDSVPN